MAKKKQSAFAEAQATVMKAFHDLERSVMAMVSTPAAPKKAKKVKKVKKTKKKAAKKTSKRAR